jgi:hypothetical protein
MLKRLTQNQPSRRLQPILPKRQHLQISTIPNPIHILPNAQRPQPTVRRIEVPQVPRLLQYTREGLRAVHPNSIITHVYVRRVVGVAGFAEVAEAFGDVLAEAADEAVADLQFLR